MPSMSKSNGRWLLPLVDGENQFSLQSTTGETGATIATLSTGNKFVDSDIDIKLKIDGSLLKNGSVIISSDTNINPNVNDQIITITKGYYNTDRQLTVKSSTTGTAADVTVTASKLGGSPSIARTNTSISGKTNVGTTYNIQDSSTINSNYFIAVQATTPATTFAASDISKTITTAGYLGDPNQITTSIATTQNTGSIYYLPIKAATATAGTADVVLYTSDSNSAGGINVSSIVDTDHISESEPTTANSYYLAFTGKGRSQIASGNQGWIPTGSLPEASKTKYFPITKAVATITKTSGTVTPTATLNSSNVTLSSTNNGISVTAISDASASITASANITTAGYAPRGNEFATQELTASAASTAETTQYISAITVPASKALTVTNNGTLTLNNSATVNETTTGGVTTITSDSTTATVTIKAKITANDGSTTNENVVVDGMWRNNIVTTRPSSPTAYFGRTYVNLGITTFNQGTTVVSGKIAMRGTLSWGTGWVTGSSMDAATFTNSPTGNLTESNYVDISNTGSAPVLSSGGYLYITKGYTDNLRISLAKLVPDAVGANAIEEYILSGYTAYNNNGELITGNIATYTGAYTTITA